MASAINPSLGTAHEAERSARIELPVDIEIDGSARLKTEEDNANGRPRGALRERDEVRREDIDVAATHRLNPEGALDAFSSLSGRDLVIA